jgi:hypothetical protein
VFFYQKTGKNLCIHLVSLLSVKILIVKKQSEVIAATNGRALTRCMNVSYAIGHELAWSLLFRCIVCIM